MGRRVLVLGGLFFAVPVACGGGHGRDGGEESGDGGTTDATTGSDSTESLDGDVGETSTDDTGAWPDCVEPEDVSSIYGSIQAFEWPYADSPIVEEGTCSIDDIEYIENGSGVTVGILQLICVPPEGGEQLVELQLGGQDAQDGRIEPLIGMSDVQLQFENWAPYTELHHHEIRLRDVDGRLLLATVVEERPSPDPGGWDGTVVGVVDGWSQADWFAPFESFVIRDDLCPVEDSSFTEFAPIGTAQRLAIEVQVEGQEHLLFHRTQEKGIETADGTYDVIVGAAWRLLETTCEDCNPVWVTFMVIAVD